MEKPFLLLASPHQRRTAGDAVDFDDDDDDAASDWQTAAAATD